MTDKDLNIKVAELCGWSHDPAHHDCNLHWKNPDRAGMFSEEDLPDYCGDLNAMREAVSLLTDVQFCKYVRTLCGYFQYKGRIPWSGEDAGLAERATVRQRAEAFVLTMEGAKPSAKPSKRR